MEARNQQMILMARARAQGSFNPSQLTEIIFGGKDEVACQDAAFKRVEKRLRIDDTSALPKCYGNMNREEMLLEGFRSGKVLLEDGLTHRHNVFEETTNRWAWNNASPFGVHLLLFLPMLRLQASPEQLQQWLPLAESGKMLGSYCQTELGHGTFVRGIETTATFDAETDQFVIDTPSLSATKFWPGFLACCTHTIVIARMIIEGEDFGVHSFLLQLRSTDNYNKADGVQVGDIGLKMSYNGTDNGWATFQGVRIPRSNLLMRFSSVARDGTYTSVPHREKLLYGGMLKGRCSMLKATTFQLAQAVTIATRYSTVRMQGYGPVGGPAPELAIISYKSQHYRLLSLTAKAYANLFAWKTAVVVYADLNARQEKADHTTLAYTHMLMAGLKAWASQIAADGAEEARKCCGGQGYVMISGLPEIVGSVTACATFEGENFVMWQQVARYLVKGVSSTSTPEDMAYIMKYKQSRTDSCTAHTDFRSHEVLLSIFGHRAARMTLNIASLLAATQEDLGSSPASAWNQHMIPLISAARAHIEFIVLENFIAYVSAVEPGPVREALDRLVSLYGITAIVSPTAIDAITFVENGYLSISHLDQIRSEVNILLEELLPDAIALTDAFNFTDASLCSAIGMRDGSSYETIMQWTKQLPINHGQNSIFDAIFGEFVQPVLARETSTGSQTRGEVLVKSKL